MTRISRALGRLRVAVVLAALAFAPAAAAADPHTRITFPRGASGTAWTGVIADGAKSFRLRLGQGQSLTVGGDDVYTWLLVAPDGRRLGCEGGDYCVPGAAAVLPVGGDYTILTDYRMGGCADCGHAKTRKVRVTFEAK